MSRWCKFILLMSLFILILSGCQVGTQEIIEIQKPTDTSEAESPVMASATPRQVLQETESSVETSLPENNQFTPAISTENAGTLSLVSTLEIENPGSLLWTQDSRFLIVRSFTTIYRIDINKMKIVCEYSPEQENAQILDMSPDGHLVAISSDMMNIDLVDIDTHEIKRSINIPEMFIDASFSRDGKLLAVAGAERIEAQLWNIENGKLSDTITGFETAAPVYGFTFSPDSRQLLWVSRGKAQVMDITSGSSSIPFYHEDFINEATLSADGKILACSTAATVEDIFTPVIQLWDVTSGNQIGQLITIGISHPSISPDSRLLAAGNGPYLFVWDLSTLEELAILDGVSSGINSVKFSPDGKTIASSAQDNTIRFWQVTQEK